VTEKRVALNQYWIGGGPYRFETASRWYDYGAVQRLEEFNKEWREYNTQMVEVRRARGERPPIITYWEEAERGNMAMVEVSSILHLQSPE
jgi:NDP-sugar pyrophosphorylase family protein